MVRPLALVVALGVFAPVFVSATPCRADDDDPQGSAAGPPDSDARSWDFGIRAASGLAWFDRVQICLFESCGDTQWSSPVVGLEATASLGRPSSHWRWTWALAGAYGPGSWSGEPTVGVVRLLTGVRALTDPGGSSSLLFEALGGASYFAFPDEPTYSVPMASVSVGLGGRVARHFDLLLRADLDTIVLESSIEGSFLFGYAF